MNWQKIRELHPDNWVVIEALDGRSENAQRIIEQMSVHGMHDNDWKPAWEQYKQLHRADKIREYYVIHTSREEMNIGTLDVFGRQVENE